MISIHLNKQKVPNVFWTALTVIIISGSVKSQAIGDRNEPHALVSPDISETYIALNKLRELRTLFGQQLQREVNQAARGGAGTDVLLEELMHSESLPQPLALNAGSSFIDPDTSKEETKRGSYMSLCHFKICNMGRKRNNAKWNPWYRK